MWIVLEFIINHEAGESSLKENIFLYLLFHWKEKGVIFIINIFSNVIL
jgi:hypothetical protein